MADVIKNQMTKEGFEELQNELAERKTTKMAEISAKLEEAKAQGDLSENSEYDEAKAEQSANAERIAAIEAILKNAEVVDDSELTTEKVALGSIVTLQNTVTKEEFKYKLVGESEVDFKKRKISENSPVGRAISGRFQFPLPQALSSTRSLRSRSNLTLNRQNSIFKRSASLFALLFLKRMENQHGKRDRSKAGEVQQS